MLSLPASALIFSLGALQRFLTPFSVRRFAVRRSALRRFVVRRSAVCRTPVRRALRVLSLSFILWCGGGKAFAQAPSCDCILATQSEECKKCTELCKTKTALDEALQVEIKKCMDSNPQQAETLYEGSARLLSLLSTLEEIKDEAAGRKLPSFKPPACKDLCYMKEEVTTNAHPKQFHKNSCPKKHLKDHRYKETIHLDSSVCEHPDYKANIYWQTSEFVKSLLKKPKDAEMNKPPFIRNPAAKLWSDCPKGCSFYTTYTVAVNRSACTANVDLKVNCGHQKKGGFMGNAKYNVQVKRNVYPVCQK